MAHNKKTSFTGINNRLIFDTFKMVSNNNKQF